MLPVMRRFGDAGEPMGLLRRDWDRWFDRMLPEEEWLSGYPVNIREVDGKVEVEAEMPGFKKEDIEVHVEDDILHIRAERKEHEKKGKEHLHERRYSKVERHLRLPAAVDATHVKAKLNEGVLYLAMPEKESSKLKQIDIQ